MERTSKDNLNDHSSEGQSYTMESFFFFLLKKAVKMFVLENKERKRRIRERLESTETGYVVLEHVTRQRQRQRQRRQRQTSH